MTRAISQFGSELQSRLKQFFDSPPGPDAAPLEIRERVLDEVERRLEPAGRGRRVFPYNRILVRIVASEAERAAFAAVFHDVAARARERLRELRSDPPPDLEASVTFLSEAPAEWAGGAQRYHVEYQRCTDAPTAPLAPARQASLQLTILKGAAAQTRYAFCQRIVSVGRTAEATDRTGRTRRNDVAFDDTADGTTETVGRAHANVTFDAGLNHYLIFDEGSSNGTSVVRQGVTIPVPPRDPRGVRIESGDHIRFGRAVVVVSLTSDGHMEGESVS